MCTFLMRSTQCSVYERIMNVKTVNEDIDIFVHDKNVKISSFGGFKV